MQQQSPSSKRRGVSKHLAAVGGLALAATALAFGCAKGSVDFSGPGGGGNASTSSGGATGGGGNGGGTPIGPCGVDCASIKVAHCQIASCNETIGKCEVKPSKDGDSCEDGKFCTTQDTCLAGVCVGGPPNTCASEAPPCNEMVCDEQSKSCSAMPAMNGSFCTPDDKCQINGKCQFGNCIGTYNNCKFSQPPDQCHVMKCNPMNGMCEPEIGNEGLGCVDKAELCTVGKKCQNGTCVGGSPKDCSAFTKGCFDGKCDKQTGNCYGSPIAQGGKCAEATDSCNDGFCDANGKCVPTNINEGMACDDGLTCTSGTKCEKGACKGGTSSVAIYLYEEFASNSKGWTLGKEWEVGPAKESKGFYKDPSLDHTVANQNNGIAGVVIGGDYVTPQTHDFYFLTSPAVDTSSANTLYFEYWRWLNSDYTPYVQNKVEVFDGNQWVTLWASGSFPGVEDKAWQKISFDITKYKNSKLQVRFGFNIGSSGVYAAGGWNVDDVLISAAQCQ
jgi:hypothetical protein